MNKLVFILVALSITGCAATQVADTQHLREHPEQYLVLGVKNDPDSSYAHAGSTTKSYNGVHDYAQSTHARRLLKEIAREYQMQVVDGWPIPMLAMQCVVFKPAGAESGTTLIARLQSDPRVMLAQPLQNFATNSSERSPPDSGSYRSLQQSLHRMDIDAAHQWSTGKGISIAVIDTGMDLHHPDLKGRIVAERNFVDNDQQQFVEDRHGTEIAGVIAADASNTSGIVGIAPEARLIAIKACWQLEPNRDAAHCNTLTLAKGIASAVQLHARVINLSIVGPDDTLLNALIKEAQRAGVVVVGASDIEGMMRFPAAVSGVIGVTSMEQHSAGDASIAAPGQDVLTLLPGGRYDFASGNSIATAEVTGTVALLMAGNTGRTLDTPRLRELLVKSTESSPTDHFASINACLALSQLLGKSGCDHSSIEATRTAKSITP